MTERGKFITIEGADGAGKSTQATRLAKHLNETGHQSFLTREPGGCPGAERIRSLLLDSHAKWEPDAEVLLHFAARRQHIQDAIIPFLDRGYWVVSDRFYDSTRAYQQFGQGASAYLINALIIDLPVRPDLTIILDVPEQEARRRLQERAVAADRYERMGSEFHARIRDGYRHIAYAEKDRCALVDASKSIEEVHWVISGLIRARGLMQDAAL